jgi:hypothetical protein
MQERPTGAQTIIAHLRHRLDDPEPYVRAVLANLWDCKRQNGDAFVRIEVGSGLGPPDYPTESLADEETGQTMITGGFSGRTHKPLPDAKVQLLGRWSDDTVSLDEIAGFLGEIRNFNPKRKSRAAQISRTEALPKSAPP